MARSKKQKLLTQMTADELAEATREFDEPFDAKRFKPLSKAERAKFDNARKSPSVSVFVVRESEGTTLVRLDPSIVKRARRYATAHQLTLSDVINRSLKGMLAMLE